MRTWSWLLIGVACDERASDEPTVARASVVEAPEAEVEVPEPAGPADPLIRLSVEARAARLREIGEAVYAADGAGRCAVCHGVEGLGLRGAMPPLRGDRPWLTDCADHIGIVLYGMTGPIVLDGLTHIGVMPPQGHTLDDLQVAAVVTYVNGAWGNEGPVCLPYDTGVVRQLGPTSRID